MTKQRNRVNDHLHKIAIYDLLCSALAFKRSLVDLEVIWPTLVRFILRPVSKACSNFEVYVWLGDVVAIVWARPLLNFFVRFFLVECL